ncbi:MAG: InlB B-repeat-containing protein [Bacilli bacterium]
MAKNTNGKKSTIKPVDVKSSNVTEFTEEETNKKVILLILLSMLVVIGLIIGSIFYFQNKNKDNDGGDDNDVDAPVIVNPEVKPEPETEVKPIVQKTYELNFYDENDVLISSTMVTNFSLVIYPNVESKEGYDAFWIVQNTEKGKNYFLRYKQFYTISYLIGNETKTVKVYVGDKTQEYNPIKKGYKFNGWFTDKELKTPFDMSLALSGNVSLYPSFTYINAEVNSLNFGATSIDKGGLELEVSLTGKNAYNFNFTGKQNSNMKAVNDLGFGTDTHLMPIKIFAPEGVKVDWSKTTYSLDGTTYNNTLINEDYDPTDNSFMYVVGARHGDEGKALSTLSIKWNDTTVVTYNVSYSFSYLYNVNYIIDGKTTESTFVGGSTEKLEPAVKKDKYMFAGWFSDEKFTSEVTSFDKVFDDITLYAKYDYINGNTVSMEIEGLNINKEETTVTSTKQNNDYILNVEGVLSQASSNAIKHFGFGNDTHIIPLEIYAPENVVVDWTKVTYKVGTNEFTPVTNDLYNAKTNGFIYLVGTHLGDEGHALSKLVIKWDGKTESSYTVSYPNITYGHNISYMDGTTEVGTGSYVSKIGYNNNLMEAVVKENLNFVGWYDNALFNGTAVTKDTVASKTGMLTLYAKYENVYKLNYELNSKYAVNDKENEAILTVKESDGSIKLKDPTNSKAIRFEGWYIDKELTTKLVDNDINNIDLSKLTPNSTVTLYAKWSYVVKYDLNSEGITDISVKSFDDGNVSTNEKVLLTNTATGKRDSISYKIKGWSLTKNGNKLTEYEINEIDSDKGIVTLYAIWPID